MGEYMLIPVNRPRKSRALDPKTGRVIWRESYPVDYRIQSWGTRHGNGPLSNPTFADGRLFTFSVTEFCQHGTPSLEISCGAATMLTNFDKRILIGGIPFRLL